MAKFIPKGPPGTETKKSFITKERKKVERVKWLKYSVALNIVLISYLA